MDVYFIEVVGFAVDAHGVASFVIEADAPGETPN